MSNESNQYAAIINSNEWLEYRVNKYREIFLLGRVMTERKFKQLNLELP